MNVLKSIHDASLCSAAFAVVACLASAGEVVAADPSELRRVTVSYGDLNLSTIEGAMTLHQRLRGAARSVCGDEGRSLSDRNRWRVCYQRALADAVTTVNSPTLTAAYSGWNRGATMTAMRAK